MNDILSLSLSANIKSSEYLEFLLSQRDISHMLWLLVVFGSVTTAKSNVMQIRVQ